MSHLLKQPIISPGNNTFMHKNSVFAFLASHDLKNTGYSHNNSLISQLGINDPSFLLQTLKPSSSQGFGLDLSSVTTKNDGQTTVHSSALSTRKNQLAKMLLTPKDFPDIPKNFIQTS